MSNDGPPKSFNQVVSDQFEKNMSRGQNFGSTVRLILIGFQIKGTQAQDTSPNVKIKNGPRTSSRPLMVSLKGRPKTRAQLAPLKGWQPKEFVLGENTQSPPIRKVRYSPIITPQLSLINWFTIRKENLIPSERNIVSSSN